MDDETRAIWDSMLIDSKISDQALLKIAEQDDGRGPWPSPRDSELPAAPWPAHTDPMLIFLLTKALTAIKAGAPVEEVLSDLAVHAWFEGGIENYDRGQRDARRPRLV